MKFLTFGTSLHKKKHPNQHIVPDSHIFPDEQSHDRTGDRAEIDRGSSSGRIVVAYIGSLLLWQGHGP